MAETLAKAIPEKLYFRIGEVAHITGLKPYVLRYWEQEFGFVLPAKRGAKQRLYRRKDVELILEIKRLLYHEKYSIAGAKRKLRQSMRGRGLGQDEARDLDALLAEVKAVLREIARLLESPPARGA